MNLQLALLPPEATFFGTIGILAVLYLIVRSFYTLFLGGRIKLFEFMVLLHLPTAIGAMTLYFVKREFEFYSSCVLAGLVALVSFAGGIWGRAEAERKQSCSELAGLLIGIVAPGLTVTCLPFYFYFCKNEQWLRLFAEMLILIAFALAFRRLLKMRYPNK